MREFQGLQIKGVACPPQVVIIDGDPYVVITRSLPGLKGTINVEMGLAAIPEATSVALPQPDWSQLFTASDDVEGT